MGSNYTLERPEALNYFDQFHEYEVDLTKLIENFKTDRYTLNFSNIQPIKVKMKNLFSRYDLTFNYVKNNSTFVDYQISDYERVDQLSYKMYKQVDYWWIILLVNNIKNPVQEWPLSQEQLNSLVDLLYKYEGKYTKTTYYQLLFESNEKKKNILVPTKSAIYDILNMLREVFQNKKE